MLGEDALMRGKPNQRQYQRQYQRQLGLGVPKPAIILLCGLLALLIAGAVAELAAFGRQCVLEVNAKEMMGASFGTAGEVVSAQGDDLEAADQKIDFDRTNLAGTDLAGAADAGFEEDARVAADFPRERSQIHIVLDPGHGGEDEGCSRGDVLEKDVNLQIAEATEARLLDMGYQVSLTRRNDESLERAVMSLEERVELANGQKADLYISIHQNATEKLVSDVSGVEVWYNREKAGDGSRRLAQLVQKEVLIYTKAAQREIQENETLYVIRETQMPSCLIETGFLSDPEERERLISPEYQEKLAKGIADAVDLYFFPKTMYLTFDDGPSAENTAAVLDILKAHHIKATFFLIGENVEKHPEMAKRIVEEGHTIGIHCYNHDYDKLYRSTESYLADFERAKSAIFEATGVETTIFRFPGGSINSHNKLVYREIIREMEDRGYTYFDWNASLEDASKHNEPAQLIQNATESTLGRKKVVMLAHDVVYNTTLCLEELLDLFPEYQMLPITADVEPIQF